MARKYFLTSATSDLSGGADFSRVLGNIIASQTTLSISIAANATETSYGFTEPLVPGTNGNVTGNYTVQADVTTANSNITCAVTLRRINSAGTVQTSSSAVSGVSFGTTGVKTFSWTSLSLGAFSSTDRLRVDFAFTNSAAHTASSFALGFNDPDAFILAPFPVKSYVTT